MTSIFSLVHADMTFRKDGQPLQQEVTRYLEAGSPVIQVFVPVDKNSIAIQRELNAMGFQAFAYEPATRKRSAHLLFSKVKDGRSVVPTWWNVEGVSYPFWDDSLAEHAKRIEAFWVTQ